MTNEATKLDGPDQADKANPVYGLLPAEVEGWVPVG
jgi:hypothetical protein